MENVGPGKHHPGGLVCTLTGQKIDRLIFSSKSGVITAEILVNILKYFDSERIFLNSLVAPSPFCLLINTTHGWTQRSLLSSTILNIAGRFALVCYMQPHCGRWETQQKTTGLLRIRFIMQKMNCYFGSMSGDLPNPSSMKTSCHC